MAQGSEIRTTGTVKWFNPTKGFGFITTAEAEDVFVHQSDIHAQGYRSLAEGETVEFVLKRDDQLRNKAVKVTGPAGAYVQGESRGMQQRQGAGGFGGGDRYAVQGGGGGGGMSGGYGQAAGYAYIPKAAGGYAQHGGGGYGVPQMGGGAGGGYTGGAMGGAGGGFAGQYGAAAGGGAPGGGAGYQQQQQPGQHPPGYQQQYHAAPQVGGPYAAESPSAYGGGAGGGGAVYGQDPQMDAAYAYRAGYGGQAGQ
eukprot:Lankesteria_metandrocarpae@DN5143_c0_g1_i2.p1